MSVLLATLRPAGDLGDQNDVTYVEGSDFTGVVSVPNVPVAIGDLGVTPQSIDFLRFYAKVGWYVTGLGPDDAQVWIQWREGAGSYISTDPEFPPGGVGVYSNIPIQNPPDPIDYPTRPGGGPWTVAAVDALQMRCQFFVSDSSSGEETFVRDLEVWAEVWGVLEAPPAESNPETLTLAVDGDEATTLRADGDIALTLGCGDAGTSLACDTDITLTLACDVDEEA